MDVHAPSHTTVMLSCGNASCWGQILNMGLKELSAFSYCLSLLIFPETPKCTLCRLVLRGSVVAGDDRIHGKEDVCNTKHIALQQLETGVL